MPTTDPVIADDLERIRARERGRMLVGAHSGAEEPAPPPNVIPCGSA